MAAACAHMGRSRAATNPNTREWGCVCAELVEPVDDISTGDSVCTRCGTVLEQHIVLPAFWHEEVQAREYGALKTTWLRRLMNVSDAVVAGTECSAAELTARALELLGPAFLECADVGCLGVTARQVRKRVAEAVCRASADIGMFDSAPAHRDVATADPRVFAE